jgi:hypothetical protein
VNGNPETRKERIRASYQNVWWMSMLHGKHEPLLKEHMGRLDISHDKKSYTSGYFIPNDKEIPLDFSRLESILETFEDPETVKIGCPAAYTHVLKNVWNLVCDIYEQCELRQNKASSGTIQE